MNQQERAMMVWSVFFVVSGIVFMLAFIFSPMIGALITLAYIMLYVGLSAVFVMVFREMENIKKDTLAKLRERKEEMEEVKKAISAKYYSKRIDESSFRDIMKDYERKLTEIEVKIKRLEKKK